MTKFTLSAQVENLSKRNTELHAELEKCSANAKATLDASVKMAEQLNKERRDHATTVSTLKGEIERLLETCAQQRGYLARVREDDDMRELGPAVGQTEQKAPPQSRRSAQLESYVHVHRGAAADLYGTRHLDKPTPWYDL